MRKFVISFGVFGIFLVYSLGIRHELPVLAKPASLVSSSTNSTTSSSNNSSNSGSTGSSGSTTNSGSPSSNSTSSSTQYKDGTYTGSVEDAYYGNVQVAVTVTGGKITKVKVLQYPDSHSTSVAINQQALPYLQQEVMQSQNANVQLISGATYTSQAYIQSLTNALAQA